MTEHLAHAEDGKVIETADFPFDEIYAREEFIEFEQQLPQLTQLSPAELELGLDVMDRLLKWVWQSGMKNADGVKIRAIILCWICLKELRSLSMTDMATGYGLDKQSLDRWVNQDPKCFKKIFPTVRIPHMRS